MTTNRNRRIPSSRNRHFSDRGHLPPNGKHARGREGAWFGTRRIIDRPARRRAMKRTWKRLLDNARREVVAARREPN